MKKGITFLSMMLVLLFLPACAGGTAGYAVDKTPQALLDADVFSEALEALDLDIACMLYGIEESAVKAGTVYASTGATAEEIAVFEFQNEDDAKANYAMLERRLSDQKAACENYLPLEMPKLNAAILSQKGATLLYVVAADAAAAQSVLDGK